MTFKIKENKLFDTNAFTEALEYAQVTEMQLANTPDLLPLFYNKALSTIHQLPAVHPIKKIAINLREKLGPVSDKELVQKIQTIAHLFFQQVLPAPIQPPYERSIHATIQTFDEIFTAPFSGENWHKQFKALLEKYNAWRNPALLLLDSHFLTAGFLGATQLGWATHAAAAQGNLEVVQAILQMDQWEFVPRSRIEDALRAASEKGFTQIVEVLAQNERFNEVDPNILGAAFRICVEKNHIEIVELFLNSELDIQIHSFGFALEKAASNNYPEIAKALIQSKYFQHIRSEELHWAFCSAKEKNHTEIVQALQTSGRYGEFSRFLKRPRHEQEPVRPLLEF